MRTVFEVAPAGKYSRRLREPSPPSNQPKKSLCSLLIAASPPKKLLADSFTPSLTKAAGRTEEVRYGWVEGGEKKDRKEGGGEERR